METPVSRREKGLPPKRGWESHVIPLVQEKRFNGSINLNKIDLFRKARLDLWKVKSAKEQEKQFKINVIKIAFQEYPGISITTIARILNTTEQNVSLLIKKHVKQVTGFKK